MPDAAAPCTRRRVSEIITGSGGSGPRTESFALLAGGPATNDILDGVDDTWNRVTGGAEIGKLIDGVIAQFDPQDPAAGVPALLQIKKNLAALPADDPVLNEKRQQLDRIIQECLGLTVETTIPDAEIVPGELLKMHLRRDRPVGHRSGALGGGAVSDPSRRNFPLAPI